MGSGNDAAVHLNPKPKYIFITKLFFTLGGDIALPPFFYGDFIMPTKPEIRHYAKQHNINNAQANEAIMAERLVSDKGTKVFITPNQIEVRLATKDDVRKASQLQRSFLYEYKENGGGIGRPVPYNNMLAEMSRHIEEQRIAVAIVEDKIVGQLALNHAMQWIGGDTKWCIETCYVVPSYRCNGISTQLYKFALSNMNAIAISLEWGRVTEKMDYWNKLGFSTVFPMQHQNSSDFGLTKLVHGSAPLSGQCFPLNMDNLQRHWSVVDATDADFNMYDPLGKSMEFTHIKMKQ